jgi:hypothetical protein
VVQLVFTCLGDATQVAAVGVHRSNILSVAGARMGVSCMAQASHGAGGTEAVKVEPLRLRSLAGAKQVDRMTCIQVLPHSQLFVVATEDGMIKICS